jgi:hypothetical protein
MEWWEIVLYVLLVVILIAVLALLGWSIWIEAIRPVTGIQEGEIVKLEYQPESTYVMNTPITSCTTTGTGENTSTTCVTTNTSYVMHDDEDWVVYIQDYDEERDKTLRNMFYISEERYDELSVGDWFVRTKIDSVEDEDEKMREAYE